MLGQEWHRKPKDGRATRCKRPRSLTVLELTKEVCADFLQTSLCEGKINFHLVSTFFFFFMQPNLVRTDTGPAQRRTSRGLNPSAERRVRGTFPSFPHLSLSGDRGRGWGVTSGLFTTHW